MEEMMEARTVQTEVGTQSGGTAAQPVAATLSVTVVNPADNAQFQLDGVPAETTPAQLMERLVREGYVPAPLAGRAYMLSIRGGQLLDPSQGLGAAGVPSGATLQMFMDTPGATRRARGGPPKEVCS